jgi:hypothetical protein
VEALKYGGKEIKTKNKEKKKERRKKNKKDGV